MLPSFSRVVLWNDKERSLTATPNNANEALVVGGIVCRLETDPKGVNSIYVQSLALLSPYRSKGLATALLDSIIEASVLCHHSISSLYAHVWTENIEGLDWYLARGFTKEEPAIQGYYWRLKPDTAWVLRRNITPSDHLQYGSGKAPASAPVKAVQQDLQHNIIPPSLQLPKDTEPKQNGNSLNSTATKPPLHHASSFQNRAPDREWNDLPEDILSPTGTVPCSATTRLNVPTPTGSSASSRSSSRSGTVGKRKKREYPKAAFGE